MSREELELLTHHAYRSTSGNNILILLNQSMQLALEEQDPDKSIQKLIEFWGRELDSDRTYIFELKGNVYDNTYEWCKEGVRPEINGLQGIPEEVASIWKAEFEKDGHAVVKDVEDIKDSDPLLYAVLKPQELHSVITAPIYNDGELIGFYGVDNPPAEKMDMITNALPIIGNFMDSLIIRRNLMEELLRKSIKDSLTGIANKHAMDLKVEHLDQEKSCAIVFCDICGLKQTNDHFGHEAGDKLIKQVASNLTTIFGLDSVFRIGGDEFVVMTSEVSEEEMKEKIKNLRVLATETKAPIAIGEVWSANNHDVSAMVKEADAKMYEDKKIYYSQSGTDRRSR